MIHMTRVTELVDQQVTHEVGSQEQHADIEADSPGSEQLPQRVRWRRICMRRNVNPGSAAMCEPLAAQTSRRVINHSRNVGARAFYRGRVRRHEVLSVRRARTERARLRDSRAHILPIAGNSMRVGGGPADAIVRTTGPRRVDRSNADGCRRSAAPWRPRRREAPRLRRARRDRRAPRAGARAG